MILAHNDMLYSYHKYLMEDLERAPDKPAAVVGLARRLIESPSKETAHLFYDCIMGFTKWPEAKEGWAARFIADTEYNWRSTRTPIEDR